MTTTLLPTGRATSDGSPTQPAPVLDVVVPVHNEEVDLVPRVRRPGLRQRLRRPPLRPRPEGDSAELPGQLVRFAAIGIVSTLAYLALFWLLRIPFGAQTANVVALATTAVANTAANRRVTFGITGRRHAARHHLQGLAVFGLGLALTSGSLAVLHAVSPQPDRFVELVTVVLANLAATLLRFVLLRFWFHHRRAVSAASPLDDGPAPTP
jgi:putative flippase GtrA